LSRAARGPAGRIPRAVTAGWATHRRVPSATTTSSATTRLTSAITLVGD